MEKELISSLDIKLITLNEEGTIFGFRMCSLFLLGKRRISNPTLFFMPHCARILNNNVLWANWTKLETEKQHPLNFLLLLGNSLTQIIEKSENPSKIFLLFNHRKLQMNCFAFFWFSGNSSISSSKDAKSSRTADCISTLAAYMKEQPIVNNFRIDDAFNDTALHTWIVPIELEKIKPRPAEIQLKNDEDPEIITSGLTEKMQDLKLGEKE